MNTDHHMRAPFFELTLNIAEASCLNKLTRFRPDLVHKPVHVLHPVLLVTKYPIVNTNEFFGNVMPFFNGLDDPDGDRFAMPEFLKAHRNCLRGTPMSTTG